MSDYGDDNSDYGDEWMYVEEEYMVADDLAEHAVASPTLAACAADDDAEWDRFDYFNDLEYASDGYDDAKFEVHTVKDAHTGQKRKRDTKPVRSTRKRPRSSHHADGIATNQDALAVLGQSPVVWRSQSDRGTQPKMLDDNAKAYTLLGDWRDKLPDTPQSTRASPPQSHMEGNTDDGQGKGKGKGRASPAPVSPPLEMDVEDEGAHAGEMDIDPGALMAALQSRLAEAGGPLSGMDPQQLLEFAMRMAGGKDTGDDIAGEMADAIFDQGDDDEEDDTEAEANLLSWVAKQKNAPQEPSATAPSSSDGTANRKRPPSPPLSETNSSANKTADKPTAAHAKAKGAANSRTSQGATKTATKTATAGSSKTTPSATATTTTTTSKASQSKSKATTATESSAANSRATRTTRSLKRKADDAETDEQSAPDPNPNPTKKRATRSFDAPTAASEARSAPARSTRSARGKR